MDITSFIKMSICDCEKSVKFCWFCKEKLCKDCSYTYNTGDCTYGEGHHLCITTFNYDVICKTKEF